ncbi:hypothetical protein [Paenibacillus sp. NAIST15-1]|nr:hypothetical protein [Paenibacillus sp. NAIST15-1]GAV13013.1 glyoxalase/bleomycin resistance protein/dioxygenase [Paenibacillus sp. NAIST15-1]
MSEMQGNALKSNGNKFDVNECVSMHRSPEEVDRVNAHLFNPINK